jgi:hypothetical protein
VYLETKRKTRKCVKVWEKAAIIKNKIKISSHMVPKWLYSIAFTSRDKELNRTEQHGTAG